MARPRTKSPETQIYFITHRSGANSVPRVRTVVRGERASRSIVNRTTALWSILNGFVADTRGSYLFTHLSVNAGYQSLRIPRLVRIKKSNVVPAQAGWMARTVTEAPEKQIYFINHRSGANSVPRVRTVVRGERASRSIVNRTTAL